MSAATLTLPAARPAIMGILNVTPDSFSDGGEYLDPKAAVAHAEAMIAEGADIIDVGPESTRPGADPVPAAEQIRRAVPVIHAIRERNERVVISIDTRLADVAREAIAAGATMVNDVSALQDDPDMAAVVASSGVTVVLMHRRGTPADMQNGGGPHYHDVVAEIEQFLRQRRDDAVRRGIDASRIILDPGIGFGKRTEHNLMILRHLDRFVALGHPLLVGASRKQFIGAVLGIEAPERREVGSLACAAVATLAGAAILRVHAVRTSFETVRVCAAIRHAGMGEVHHQRPAEKLENR